MPHLDIVIRLQLFLALTVDRYATHHVSRERGEKCTGHIYLAQTIELYARWTSRPESINKSTRVGTQILTFLYMSPCSGLRQLRRGCCYVEVRQHGFQVVVLADSVKFW